MTNKAKDFPKCVYTDVESPDNNPVFRSNSFSKVVEDKAGLDAAVKDGYRATLDKPKTAKKTEK